jgi:GNAT superfamily N-acetyltransferase
VQRIRLREATLDDLDVLVAHRRGMWEAIQDFDEEELRASDTSYRRWVRQRMKSGKFLAWVAETRGEVVASGAVWIRERQPRPRMEQTHLPYILSMYTEPEHRGNGIATRILQEIVRWSRREGYPRVTLHASHFGEGVYRQEGFVDTTEMVLRLKPGTGPPPGRMKTSKKQDPEDC